MVAVIGTYQNGYIKLDKEYLSEKPVKVIVTFLEDIETSSKQGLTLADFSFSKSRQALEGYEGSFSETVVDERRNEL